jgi:hypothetical protein
VAQSRHLQAVIAAFQGGDAMNHGHQHTRIREAALDETVASSFPASDPPSSLPNPDEHDADGSGVEPEREPRSARP